MNENESKPDPFFESLSPEETLKLQEDFNASKQKVLEARRAKELEALHKQYRAEISALAANRDLGIMARLRKIAELKTSYRQKGLPVF